MVSLKKSSEREDEASFVGMTAGRHHVGGRLRLVLWVCCTLVDAGCSGRVDASGGMGHAGDDIVRGVRPDASHDGGQNRDSGAIPRDAGSQTPEPLDAGIVSDAGAIPDAGSSDAPIAPNQSSPVHRWVRFEAGSFVMGSPNGEACREGASPAWGEDLHQVTLTRPFEISANEATRSQFSTVMGYLPTESVSCADNECPISRINWSEASAYCNALNRDLTNPPASCYSCTGSGRDVSCQAAPEYAGDFTRCLGYRLPTDAEWEYAYRADTTTPLYNGTSVASCNGTDANADAIAWYRGNSGDRAHPVGQKAPNPAGLYDMAGNVWNWTHDWAEFSLGTAPTTDPSGPVEATEGQWRIVRGGSYHYGAHNVRAARRSRYGTGGRSPATGVRCVRTLSISEAATSP